VGVMIGEFGVYNKTPHDVALALLEDCLANYKKAGLGWALWNFDGPFGIVDSQREDVDYEDWNGRKLNRKILDLLQRLGTGTAHWQRNWNYIKRFDVVEVAP
jgi:endoglucanase